ncbi:MAG TPA: metallophosphoesterase, partial [Myxococcota bacterium]|nr:metallophosphoesterase [Myxococcota bacterium]
MPDRYDILYVISDLHIGGRPDFEIFRESDALAWLADQAASRARPDAPVGLVLNGDVFDLLSDGDVPFDARGAADRVVAWLARPCFQAATLGLRRFVRTPGCRLVVVIGNHDLELCLPEVQTRLRDMLCQADEAARGRVVFATDGSGYRCRVGTANDARAVLCMHGEVADTWNAVDHEDLRKIVLALNLGVEPPDLTLNAGTQMVQRIINPLKYDERWPFVDLLKPEQEAAVQIAMALAWESEGGVSKTVRYAAKLLSTQPGRIRDALRRWVGWLGDEGEGEERPLGWSSTDAGRALVAELAALERLEESPAAADAGAFLGD